MANLPENPIGTDGFSFVMYVSDTPGTLCALFEKMGIPAIANHKSKNMILHRSGDINFIVSDVDTPFAKEFFERHGPSACAMGFLVKDAVNGHAKAVNRGATAIADEQDLLKAPAIAGIGGARVYFIDEYGDKGDFFQHEFNLMEGKSWNQMGFSNLFEIDHLTHNVKRGGMNVWAKYYEDIFNFREIRYFDIEGKKTGLFSKAMTSPDGRIRIPLNESQDDKSQIEEFLQEYNGEGIQHIALATKDIYQSIPDMRAKGLEFQDTIDTYFDLIDQRLPDHKEDVAKLREQKILIDGGPSQGGGFLLQIFSTNAIGPIFFEIIQRKGNEGFGEGNFQALFESIELDQERRGII